MIWDVLSRECRKFSNLRIWRVMGCPQNFTLLVQGTFIEPLAWTLEQLVLCHHLAGNKVASLFNGVFEVRNTRTDAAYSRVAFIVYCYSCTEFQTTQDYEPLPLTSWRKRPLSLLPEETSHLFPLLTDAVIACQRSLKKNAALTFELPTDTLFTLTSTQRIAIRTKPRSRPTWATIN